MSLAPEERVRYQRQLVLPQFGKAGQEKLKAAKVLIAGVGGLGAISAYYLVAAGVGQVTLVDRDQVELDNLNRQIIHWTTDLGAWKTDSAARKLKALNPNCDLRTVRAEINAEKVMALVGDATILVDATDNLEARRALNLAAWRKKVLFIYGGVKGFEGMVTTFVPGETACFECVFPNRTAPESPPGIAGPLPGVVASLQALEAIKIILGLEGTLIGRLLCFDGLHLTFREIRLGRNPDCRVCSGSIEECA